MKGLVREREWNPHSITKQHKIMLARTLLIMWMLYLNVLVKSPRRDNSHTHVINHMLLVCCFSSLRIKGLAFESQLCMLFNTAHEITSISDKFLVLQGFLRSGQEWQKNLGRAKSQWNRRSRSRTRALATWKPHLKHHPFLPRPSLWKPPEVSEATACAHQRHTSAPSAAGIIETRASRATACPLAPSSRS